MKLLLNWLVSAAAIMIAAYVLPGIDVSGWVVALILAIVLGAINAFVRPLMVLLTLPVTMLTLGLFLFVIDALVIMLAGAVVPGFMVASFWWALAFSLVLSLVSAVFSMMGANPVHD